LTQKIKALECAPPEDAPKGSVERTGKQVKKVLYKLLEMRRMRLPDTAQ
jgi:hypothetical protein